MFWRFKHRFPLNWISVLLGIVCFLRKFWEKMSTLRVPDAVPPPAQDCEKLQKAFQGLLSLLLSHFFLGFPSSDSWRWLRLNHYYIKYLFLVLSEYLCAFCWWFLGYFGGCRVGNRREGNNMGIGTQKCKPKEDYQRHLSASLQWIPHWSPPVWALWWFQGILLFALLCLQSLIIIFFLI